MSDRTKGIVADAAFLLVCLLGIFVAIYSPGCATIDNCVGVIDNCSVPCVVKTYQGKCTCSCPEPSPEVPPAPPSPSPEPSAEPSPEPTPTPAPSVRPCSIPAMPECGGPETAPGVWGCCIEAHGEAGQFEEDVRLVLEAVSADPRYVVFGRVVDADAYRNAIIAGLRDRGLCAVLGGPADEIGVKGSNVFSEQYDVIVGDDYASFFLAATCRPSRF